MRPVNLLPDSYRPRRPSGASGVPSRILIGVLAVLVVMALGYAVTANRVNSQRTAIAQAKGEIQRAQGKIAAQGAYGNFKQIKQTRESSVKLLAGGRFDWERLMRELALVLPESTWLIDVTATATPEASGSSGGSGAPAGPPASTGPSASSGPSAPTPGAASTPSGPSLHLVGCAPGQPAVATLLVRLRKLHGANDVSLTESAKEADGAASSGSSDGATAGSENCGQNRFKFDVNVTFATPGGAQPRPGARAPAGLGGGS
jgi:Tfp pilus assembly protein PilN